MRVSQCEDRFRIIQCSYLSYSSSCSLHFNFPNIENVESYDHCSTCRLFLWLSFLLTVFRSLYFEVIRHIVLLFSPWPVSCSHWRIWNLPTYVPSTPSFEKVPHKIYMSWISNFCPYPYLQHTHTYSCFV